ncbi:MAG: sigma-70 family RNA polymerase sigma factor [Fuerstiella sp.]
MSDENDDFEKPERQTEFLSFFTKDHQRIFGYIFSQLHNRADTEDVFQQTSLSLWRRFDEFDRDREFFPWACGVAFNTVRNFLRKSGRSRLHFNDELLSKISEERVASDTELQAFGDRLDQCINRLGEKDRKLIRQAYRGNQTVIEIAETMGRAVRTLYNRLNLIRRKLAECMEAG